MNTKYTPELLTKMVSESDCFSDLIRRLGLNYSGSTHGRLKHIIVTYGIDFSHFTGKRHFLGKPAPNRKDPFSHDPKRWKRQDQIRVRQAMIESGIKYECTECGQRSEWNGKSLTLQIDHIDGNWRDSRKENLRFLCPNCHTQTPTFSKPKSGTPLKGINEKNIEAVCMFCKKAFLTKQFRLNEIKRNGRQELFCSPGCAHDAYRKVSDDLVISTYKECRSMLETGRLLSISKTTVKRKLIKAGIHI